MRRSVVAFLTTCTLLVLAGCERTHETLMSNPDPLPLRLTVADASYRLEASARAKLLPGFDVEALERLLGMVRPDLRQPILRHFQQRARGERLGHLVQVHDAELQAVLEEVWAPMWDEVKATDAQIEANHFGFPGREAAKRRRAERARVQRSGSE
jgi:hypothetical protein